MPFNDQTVQQRRQQSSRSGLPGASGGRIGFTDPGGPRVPASELSDQQAKAAESKALKARRSQGRSPPGSRYLVLTHKTVALVLLGVGILLYTRWITQVMPLQRRPSVASMTQPVSRAAAAEGGGLSSNIRVNRPARPSDDSSSSTAANVRLAGSSSSTGGTRASRSSRTSAAVGTRAAAQKHSDRNGNPKHCPKGHDIALPLPHSCFFDPATACAAPRAPLHPVSVKVEQIPLSAEHGVTDGQYAYVYMVFKITKPYLRIVQTAIKSLRAHTTHDILIAVPKLREDFPDKSFKDLQKAVRYRSMNARVVRVDYPFRSTDLTPDFARLQEENRNCCGWKEFLKMSIWAMTRYKKIVVLDADTTILRNVDSLFGCDHSVDVMHTAGPGSPWNCGVYVLRPSRAVYEDMRRIVLEGNFTNANGWLGTKHVRIVRWRNFLDQEASTHGAEGPQGFFYYYFRRRFLLGNTSEENEEDRTTVVDLSSSVSPVSVELISREDATRDEAARRRGGGGGGITEVVLPPPRVKKFDRCTYNFQGESEFCLEIWREGTAPRIIHKWGEEGKQMYDVMFPLEYRRREKRTLPMIENSAEVGIRSVEPRPSATTTTTDDDDDDNDDDDGEEEEVVGELSQAVENSPHSSRTRLRSRCLASFFIIGARKGGTTSLYHYISQHPHVKGVSLDAGPQAGELFFFQSKGGTLRWPSSPRPFGAPKQLRSRKQQPPTWGWEAYPGLLKEIRDGTRMEKQTGRKGIRIFNDARVAYDKLVRTKLNKEDKEDKEEVVFHPEVHITGESTVGYISDCNAPVLLRRTCGVLDTVEEEADAASKPRPMKILFLARDPVDRMISQFRMRVRLGTNGYTQATNMSKVFLRNLEDVRDRQRLRRDVSFSSQSSSSDDVNNMQQQDSGQNAQCLYEDGVAPNGVWMGMYAVHLRRWREQFPHEMKIITSEEFFEKPNMTLRSVYDFLGLDPKAPGFVGIEEVVKRQYNTQTDAQRLHPPKRQTLLPEVRAKLEKFFEPYNLALSREFGVDVSEWSSYIKNK